ncbi:MAG: EamA family transporter [Candidatus Marsarchaeota archaeon]|nr:EamA family transporter [Candidatus Marsarchaeota archaeon]
MDQAIGIICAGAALVFWGVGDFLIQRTTRRVGDWETLFIISIIGVVIFTPFVYGNIGYLFSAHSLVILALVSAVMFSAALIDFEALKNGKISVVAPLMSLEVPVAATLSVLFLSETLQPVEIVLVALIVVGLGMVSLKSNDLSKKVWLERGVMLAVAAAVLLGLADFLVGFGSRTTSPLMINWFISVTLTVYTLVYITAQGNLRGMLTRTRKAGVLVVIMGILDNGAWLAFAFATVFIPITLTVAISENYIALAAILGLLVGGERLMKHQKIGLVIALASAVVLSLLA